MVEPYQKQDFSDVWVVSKIMFDLFKIDESSDRVQAYLKRFKKQSLAELSLEEYANLNRAMVKAWGSQTPEYQRLYVACDRLINKLGLTWNHKALVAFVEKHQIKKTGIEQRHLEILHAALLKQVQANNEKIKQLCQP